MANIKMHEDTESVYWAMLMEIEGRTNPKTDVLNTMLVETAYSHWNRTHPKNKPIYPRWVSNS